MFTPTISLETFPSIRVVFSCFSPRVCFLFPKTGTRSLKTILRIFIKDLRYHDFLQDSAGLNSLPRCRSRCSCGARCAQVRREQVSGRFWFPESVGQRTDRYLHANMSHTAHAFSGYTYTRTRTASLTWSPRQHTISSQNGDLHRKWHRDTGNVKRCDIWWTIADTDKNEWRWYRHFLADLHSAAAASCFFMTQTT